MLLKTNPHLAKSRPLIDLQLEKDCVVAAEFLLWRMSFLGIRIDPILGYVSSDGFVDVPMRENQVRCMVRKDFHTFIDSSPDLASRMNPRMVAILLDAALQMLSRFGPFRLHVNGENSF